jgi:CubicO group peptidase (beta-lactamase class C family)
MFKGASLAVAASMLIACVPAKEDPGILRRISAVENGLVEFVPGSPGPAGAPKALSLIERMAVHHVPGVGVAVFKDGKIEWVRGYGVLKAGADSPVTADTIFQAASTTKMLVAASVLRFAGQGRLDLDRDVNEYLKSWKVPENEFTREKKVTLRHLLTHQSGLPMTNFPTDDGPPPTLVQVLKGEAPARNKPAVPGFVPGTQWQYSNIGYAVVQLLLEDLTGKPLARLMQDVVFGPLGMTSSTLDYPLPPVLRPREIIPHDAEGHPGEPAMEGPARAQGGLMTTPRDLALFCAEMVQAFRGGSDRLLDREMARLMLRPELDLDPALLGMPLRAGLGVILSPEGEPFWFGHPGDNYPGASCWTTAYPELGVGIVIMTNGAMGNLLVQEILPAFVAEYVSPLQSRR